LLFLLSVEVDDADGKEVEEEAEKDDPDAFGLFGSVFTAADVWTASGRFQ
jgi:hypothetical protein